MEIYLSIALGAITTAIAVFNRRTDSKSKKIVKALKIASAAITESMQSEDDQVS